jgi:hypothetical protein
MIFLGEGCFSFKSFDFLHEEVLGGHKPCFLEGRIHHSEILRAWSCFNAIFKGLRKKEKKREKSNLEKRRAKT